MQIFGIRRDYITGNSFKACTNYFVENGHHNFDPKKVPTGSIIYIETHELEYFFKQVFPRIPNSIKLITHNSDHPAPGNFINYLDNPKIIAWFGQNPNIIGHPKFYPLPIGIANYKWPHGKTEIFDQILDELDNHAPNRKNKLYINFARSTNPIRVNLYKQFKNKNFTKFAPRQELAKYLQEMSQYKFVLSPFGNGLDCHRTWEALLIGAIPVVLTSTLDPLYLDLPVIIVNNWQEITIDFLTRKHKEIKIKAYKYEKLFMPYWIALINSI